MEHVGVVHRRHPHRLVRAREPARVLGHRDPVAPLDAATRQERRARRGGGGGRRVGVEHDDPGRVDVERLRHARQERGHKLVEAEVGQRHVGDPLELAERRGHRLRLAAGALLELPAVAFALGGTPLRQVADLDDRVQRRPVLVGDHGGAHERGHRLALGAEEADLHVEAGQLAGLDPPQVIAQHAAVVPVREARHAACQQIGVRAAEHREQCPVRVQEATVERRQRDPDRGVLEGRPEAALALAQRALLLVEVDEDRDLRPQHQRVERLQDVVDGTRGVTPEHMVQLLADRRQEDDRDVARLLAPLDVGGCLEAVQVRHLDVHQDQGELVAQEVPEGRVARRGAHERLPERLEHGLERDEVLLLVVDQQDLGGGGRAHRETPDRRSARKGPIRSSGRTRRAAPRAMAAAGMSPRSAVAGSWATVYPPAATIRSQARRSILVHARQQDTDRPRAVAGGRRLEEHVDGRPRELHRFIGAECQVARLDQ